MARYKLLVGVHAGRDYDAEPTPVLDAEGKVWKDPKTGKPQLRYPPKLYKQGDTVEDDNVDLVQFGGSEKFAYVDGPPKQVKAPPSKNFQVAPGGQVMDGHQATTSLPDGTMVSGLANDKALALQAQAEADLKADRADKAKQQAPTPKQTTGHSMTPGKTRK